MEWFKKGYKNQPFYEGSIVMHWQSQRIPCGKRVSLCAVNWSPSGSLEKRGLRGNMIEVHTIIHRVEKY